MKKKYKVIVIGDSHAWECAAEIKSNLKKDFEVQGFVSSGTGVNTIITSAIRDIQQLSKQDVVVVWGGLKDVGRNETKQYW
jgi:predicted phosphodiesterase